MFSDLLNAPFIISILVALTVHEWAHAFVADKLGDHTAREEGRLTLNPIAHLDPLGTLLFFLVRFGWGKPVPVNPRNFRKPKRDYALVAVAGPVSNLILAFIAFLSIKFLAPSVLELGTIDTLLSSPVIADRLQVFLIQILMNSLFINLGLMAFNLLPIAPLDGSNILQAFIPLRYEDRYHDIMQKGPMILLGLLIAENILRIPILLTWITVVMEGALRFMSLIVGM